MKAVISNRIYLEVTEEYKDFLNKELTYTIPSYNPTDPPLVIKNMSRVKTNLVTIPVGRTDLIPKEYEVVDKRVEVPEDFPEFKFLAALAAEMIGPEIEFNIAIPNIKRKAKAPEIPIVIIL